MGFATFDVLKDYIWGRGGEKRNVKCLAFFLKTRQYQSSAQTRSSLSTLILEEHFQYDKITALSG